MEKHIVSIEFRFRSIPRTEYSSDCESRHVTIGIYDTLDDAIKHGNEALNKLKSRFKFSDCFSKHGGVFGSPNRLVVNWENSRKPQFFATIETLHFDDLEETMDEVFDIHQKYYEWRDSEEE